MTDRQIEEKVKAAFTSDIPDNFDAILEKCEHQEKIIAMPKESKWNKKLMMRVISTAAVVVIVFTAGLVGHHFTKDNLDNSGGSFFEDAGDVVLDTDNFFEGDDVITDNGVGSTEDDDTHSDNVTSNGKDSIDSSSNVEDDVMYPNFVVGGNNGGTTGKKKISLAQAREIALKDAGLTEDQIYEDYNDETWFDPEDYLEFPDDGAAPYIIDFATDLYVYEYKIDPISGNVLSFKKTKKYIGFEKAKELLLQEIGKFNEEITKIDMDFYGEHYIFEISFGNASCTARIDAKTGLIKEIKTEGFEETDSPETESSDTASTVPKDTAENEQN